MMLFDVEAAVAAARCGAIDASLRAVAAPDRPCLRTSSPFGSDALLDTIADTPALATFMGGRTRLTWPAGHGLRRITVTGPTPVHPHSLLWHRDNPRQALATLRAHLAATAAGHNAAGIWTPRWTPPH